MFFGIKNKNFMDGNFDTDTKKSSKSCGADRLYEKKRD